MNGKFFNQSKQTPKSFLTGLPFKPNDGKIKQTAVKVKCILTNKMTKKFMSEKNTIYFDNKSWLQNHQSKSKVDNRNNQNAGSNISNISREQISPYFQYKNQKDNNIIEFNFKQRPSTSLSKPYCNENILLSKDHSTGNISRFNNCNKAYSIYSKKPVEKNKHNDKSVKLKRKTTYGNIINNKCSLLEREINKNNINSLLEERLYLRMNRPKTPNPQQKPNNKPTRREKFERNYQQKNSEKPNLHGEYGKIPE